MPLIVESFSENFGKKVKSLTFWFRVLVRQVRAAGMAVKPEVEWHALNVAHAHLAAVIHRSLLRVFSVPLQLLLPPLVFLRSSRAELSKLVNAHYRKH